MKNMLKTVAICASFIQLVGCEKDEGKMTMNASVRVESNISASTLVSDRTWSNTTALIVSWETKGLGIQLAPVYIVEFENIVAGKAKPFSAERSPFTLTVKKLNEYLVGLGLKTGVATDVRVLVRTALSGQHSLVPMKTLKITPYFDEIKVSEWGVVSSATPNGWNSPDTKTWNSTDDDLVAYATLSAGKIKFRKNNDRGVNLGGSNGTLSSGRADIAVAAGTYKTTINVSKNTYTVETYSWGITGSDAKDWGDNGDVTMTYEGSTNSWVMKNIVLDGEIKFRLNHSWGTNFRTDSTDNLAAALEGDIKSGGSNIKVPAGAYNMSFSFDANNKGTCKIEKL